MKVDVVDDEIVIIMTKQEAAETLDYIEPRVKFNNLEGSKVRTNFMRELSYRISKAIKRL